jgi:hypothetical protein
VAEAHASGIGLFGSIGLEAKLTRNLSILVEGTFQRASISGFSGKTRTRYNDSEFEESLPFDLFYYEFGIRGTSLTYPALSLPGAQRGYLLRGFREGVIDLTGWALRAGLRIIL